MECPYCSSNLSRVIDSRKVEMNVFRTRVCKKCGSKFYTEEVTITEEEAKFYMAEIKRKYRKERKNYNGKNSIID